jgi:putative tryptophan/tyrosine transport system substrate-binding protein
VKRREFITLLGGAAAGWPLIAYGQRAKMQQIGLIQPSSRLPENYRAFRDGLRDLGYVEGQNIALDMRIVEGPSDLPKLVEEVLGRPADIIVTVSARVTLAARAATSTIPIVMLGAGDPVGTGLVASLARPGGNVTGLSLLVPELSGKRLALLKELIPQAARIAVLANPANPVTVQQWRETQEAAQRMGIALRLIEVRERNDLDGAISAAAQANVNAVDVLGDPVFVENSKQLAELTLKHRLPAIAWQREFADAGGLTSYGPSFRDLWRRAASYVDKILKGATPANLPVEQPTKFEFVVNLKTAKALGLEVPTNRNSPRSHDALLPQ